MEPEEQLRWEARAARPAAAAAFGSAAFYIVSAALEAPAGRGADNDREALEKVHDNGGLLVASLAARVVAYTLLAFAFLYLMRASIARRPSLPTFVLPLFFLAPALLAIGGLIDRLDVIELADDFMASERRSEALAERLLDDRSVVGQAIASGGTLCLALSFVAVSLNAMRVGLLSRFMGALGIAVGFLTIVPIFPIQVFWVVALGLLLLGQWPGGRGPAWETVEAIPWPSAAQARDAALLEERAAEAVEEANTEADRPARRKRKRRRKR